ncbi:MAG: NADPH-dependent glutamate synthase [Chloroflexota bacterium]|nr:NADPH-dependent glutamate synthase [Chloroflexota bacterium]
MAKVISEREEMPRQKVEERIHNFEEVNLGFDMELAQAEAERCLLCPQPPCVEGCPVEIDIPGFIAKVREGDMMGAVEVLRGDTNLPAICSRVCPQEEQCEGACVLGKRFEPVAIGHLERFVADWDLERGVEVPELPPPTGKRVAVVGSGPGGLTCAADLAKMGHEVTIFESLPVSGGMLMHGIPAYRLPRKVVQAKIDYVKKLGVEIRLNSAIGELYTVDELLGEQGYDAVFLGTGADLPRSLGLPGENLNGIYSGIEFLTRINLMKTYKFPEYDASIKVNPKVVVIGAGDVAMDSARCALRLGAAEVKIVYRRSRNEMPACASEIHHAKEEGIIFEFLTNPVSFHGDENDWVKKMRCMKMKLGEPDRSGRPRPIPIEGSDFDMDADLVIVAIGTRPNPLVFSGATGLERTERGTIVANEGTGRTTKERVWCGGDVLIGAATVVSAMGAGKRAAIDIDRFLRKPEASWTLEGRER